LQYHALDEITEDRWGSEAELAGNVDKSFHVEESQVAESELNKGIYERIPR